MRDKQLYAKILGLKKPWSVEDIELSITEKEVSSQKVLANDSSIILKDMHSNDDVRWFFIFTSTF